MKQKLHVIYIPGVGAGDYKGQRLAVKAWQYLWGVETEFFPSHWDDKQPWAHKKAALLSRVDSLAAKGKRVGLVGVSAGASAAINIYAARKNQIAGVVCVAGKINHPEAIGASYRENNPALLTSAIECQTSLRTLGQTERRRILSIYGFLDGYVPKRDSWIKDARNRRVSSISHVGTIATQIIFGAPFFLTFLKKHMPGNI